MQLININKAVSLAACVLGLGLLASGCKKGELLRYTAADRIQFVDNKDLSATFVYEDAAVTKDTVYLAVHTIGDLRGYDRPVSLQQIKEYQVDYTRDPVTGAVLDSTVTERPFTAVAGKHYVSFDDPGLQPLMVVKAGEVEANIPVVLLRDASLKENSYRLRVELAANSDFQLGETGVRQKTVVFSDHLERFASWLQDSYVYPAFTNFGAYSTGKHQFMIDVLQTNIDESWYQAAAAAGALNNYKVLLKEALAAFNQDPANIQSGKAPLRATEDPSSAVVSFP